MTMEYGYRTMPTYQYVWEKHIQTPPEYNKDRLLSIDTLVNLTTKNQIIKWKNNHKRTTSFSTISTTTIIATPPKPQIFQQ
jgi:hypothetical protein